MSAENRNLREAAGGKIAPQYYNPVTDQYEYAEGQGGAIKVYSNDANNQYVGYSNQPKPAITNPIAGVIYSYLELDTKDVYIYDGTAWVVI